MNLAILHGWAALFQIQKHLFVVKTGSTNVKSHFPNWQTGFCYVNFHYFDEDTMPSVHQKKAEQIDKSSQPLLAIAGNHAPQSYQIRMAIVNLIDGLSVCQWTRQRISNKKLCSHQQKCKWTRLARGNKLHPFDVIIIYYVVYALLSVEWWVKWFVDEAMCYSSCH